jgi:hypothetical protein
VCQWLHIPTPYAKHTRAAPTQRRDAAHDALLTPVAPSLARVAGLGVRFAIRIATLAVFATILPRSCRFCRASATATPAIPLEFRHRQEDTVKQFRKAAKTAMFTIPVNIATVRTPPALSASSSHLRVPPYPSMPSVVHLSFSLVSLASTASSEVHFFSPPLCPSVSSAVVLAVLQFAAGSSDGAACDGALTCRRGCWSL